MKTALRLVACGLALTVLSLGLAGCFDPFSPRIATGIGIAQKKPVPNTPEGVILLFQWCYRNRALAEYKEIFTDDYVFTFSALDPFGAPYRDRPWRREDELISAERLFVTGNAGEEAATAITLNFGNTLVDFADDRRGKDPRYHRSVNVRVVLDVQRPSDVLNVDGDAKFYVVRGDSAAIPPEIHLQPDSLRWYIEGWEDNTVQSAAAAHARPTASTPVTRGLRAADPAAAAPTHSLSFGQLKALYRSDATLAGASRGRLPSRTP